MSRFELFSKRKKKRQEGVIDVFKYHPVPQELRVQIVQICQDNLLLPESDYQRHYDLSNEFYSMIVKKLRKEYGVFHLRNQDEVWNTGLYLTKELFDHLLLSDTDRFFDAVELICRALSFAGRHYIDVGIVNAEVEFKEAIDEINYRIKEAGLGYQFSDGEIIRVDSQILHSEAVIPALEILRLPGYAGPQAEFLKAHEHYRHGRYAEALNECYKAFESLMKAICDKHSWGYDEKWAASKLVDHVISKGLIPQFYHSYLIALKSILESAIPTPRNKSGAHGSGSKPITVPPELAGYVIHITASTLLYLATMEKKIK